MVHLGWREDWYHVPSFSDPPTALFQHSKGTQNAQCCCRRCCSRSCRLCLGQKERKEEEFYGEGFPNESYDYELNVLSRAFRGLYILRNHIKGYVKCLRP